MVVFYIFSILAFLSIVFLLFLSFILFHRMNACLETAQETRRFHERVLNKTQDLEKEVSLYKEITEGIQHKMRNLQREFEHLQRTFKDLKETAVELQSAHQTRKAMLDLMKR